MSASSTTTATLHRWDDMPLEPVTEMFQRRLITGQRVMLAQVHLKRGAIVPRHSHEHEQVTSVLSGALKLTLAGGTHEVTVRPGEVLHIPSMIDHDAVALEDTRVLDVFSPPRQDWLDRTDDYLRR